MNKLVGATILMAGSSVLSLVLSLLMQIYLAFKFGALVEMDAYIAALALPTLVVTVLITSLSVVFIPIFVEYEDTRDVNQAWHIASSVLNLTLLALTLIVSIGGLFYRALMAWIVPGFSTSTLNL